MKEPDKYIYIYITYLFLGGAMAVTGLIILITPFYLTCFFHPKAAWVIARDGRPSVSR